MLLLVKFRRVQDAFEGGDMDWLISYQFTKILLLILLTWIFVELNDDLNNHGVESTT